VARVLIVAGMRVVIAVWGVVRVRCGGGRGGHRVLLMRRMGMRAGDRRDVAVPVSVSVTVVWTMCAGLGCHGGTVPRG